jgi:hypothetical protein
MTIAPANQTKPIFGASNSIIVSRPTLPVCQKVHAAPGSIFNGLKREELLAMNSMILHELYFASLGKVGASRVHNWRNRSRQTSVASRSGAISLE